MNQNCPPLKIQSLRRSWNILQCDTNITRVIVEEELIPSRYRKATSASCSWLSGKFEQLCQYCVSKKLLKTQRCNIHDFEVLTHNLHNKLSNYGKKNRDFSPPLLKSSIISNWRSPQLDSFCRSATHILDIVPGKSHIRKKMQCPETVEWNIIPWDLFI